MKLPFFKGRDLASGIELLDQLDSGCATDPRNYLCDTLGRNGLAADYALRNGIQTLKALDAYRRRIRRRMFGKVLGLKLPRGSVHAEMQGIIPQKGCRIEKWLTQPWPTLLVPTVLYLPEEAGPWPLVLLPNGHHPAGFRAPSTQHLCANLALRGYAVLSWDPPAQGERGDYYDRFSGNHHVTAAIQCALAGLSFAAFYHCEGLRLLDWILKRKEIDRKRIGVTGVSGGGSASVWLAGMDDRIHACASCMGVAPTRTLMSPFPGTNHHDEDNHLDMALPYGVNFESLLAAACPRPVLLMAGAEDREIPAKEMRRLYRHIAALYRRMGAQGRLFFRSAPEGHGYPAGHRMAMYAFFARFLGGKALPREIAAPILEAATLSCLGRDRARASHPVITARSLACRHAQETRVKWNFTGAASKRDAQLKRFRRTLRRAFRIASLKEWSFEERMRVRLDSNLALRRVRLRIDSNRFTSGLFVEPIGTAPGTCLVIGGRGDLESLKPWLPLLDKGWRLFFIKLFDCGYANPSYPHMVGKFEEALRVEDMLCACRYARQRGGRAARIFVAGSRNFAPSALYATALDPRIGGCILVNPVPSWMVLLETNQFPPGDGDLNYAGFARLRGAAVVADVDHLAAAVAPRPCLLLDPWNEKILPAKRVAARYFRLTRAAYAAQGHPGQFRVENLQIGTRHALAERAFAFLRSRSQAS